MKGNEMKKQMKSSYAQGAEAGKLSSYDVKSILIYTLIIASSTMVEGLITNLSKLTSLSELKTLIPALIGASITTAIGAVLVILKKLLQDKTNIFIKKE